MNTFFQHLKLKKSLRLYITLALVLFLPLFAIVVKSSQDVRQHASANQEITFIDDANNPITQTTSPIVHVALTSPWGVTQATSMAEQGNNVLGIQTATFQVADSYSDVNEVNKAFDTGYGPTSKSLWIGNGGMKDTSYTGLHFTKVMIPQKAVISNATIQVYSIQNSWINLRFRIMGDAVGDSLPFASTSLPSSRVGTVAKVNHASNAKWLPNTWYSLNDIQTIIQEIVNRPDWHAGNSISIILKGTGQSYARKFVGSFDGGATTAPKLVVSFDATGGITPTVLPSTTPSTVPTSVPTLAPTATTIPVLPTATPIPSTKDITLSEDSNFATNVVTISPVTTNPTYSMYTFSNTTPGTKTLYVKFRSTNGQEQVYSNVISLVTTPTPTGMTGMGSGGNSAALGLWTPNLKFDTCPTYPAGVTTDQQKSDYIKGIHDSYKVQGPDGKWYPTWHPAVDPTTGCKFGHEHGLDPSKSLVWDQVRNYFAYDANKNGVIDPTELAVAGIPFGYVNEQLDAYTTAGIMRHEDHVGHKVNFANGEPDIATDQFDTNPSGGVVVPTKTATGTPKWNNTGVRCYYLAKVHQGVSTADAFTNNLHEVMYFSDCKGGNGTYDMKSSVAIMMKFGKVGEFTNLCDGDGDRTTPVVIGTTAANQAFPGTRGDGDRLINQRSCIEKYFLVPQGKFSMNMYEAWPGTIRVTTPTGQDLLTGANMLFDVEDANRYYYPGKTHPETGTTKYDNAGFSMDLCYEQLPGGVQARSGMCDAATNYGQIKGITWDDPRSAFKGIHRGMYYMPSTIQNANGPEYWYSDPFGGNAQKTPFPGSVRQYMSSKNVNFGNLGQIDPRVSDREFPDGNGSVHAPN